MFQTTNQILSLSLFLSLPLSLSCIFTSHLKLSRCHTYIRLVANAFEVFLHIYIYIPLDNNQQSYSHTADYIADYIYRLCQLWAYFAAFKGCCGAFWSEPCILSPPSSIGNSQTLITSQTLNGLTDSHWHRHNQCKTRETNWCSFARYSKIIIKWLKYVEMISVQKKNLHLRVIYGGNSVPVTVLGLLGPKAGGSTVRWATSACSGSTTWRLCFQHV